MLKRLIPNLGTIGQPIRSSTSRHLDALVSALVLLTNVLSLSFSPRLATALSMVYHKVQFMLLVEPDKAVSTLKNYSKMYIEYVRGAPRPTTVEAATVSMGAESRPTHQATNVLDPIISLRELLVGNELNEIIWFDRIALAVLSIHRVIVSPPVLDYTTITAPYSGEIPAESIMSKQEIESLLVDIGITPAEFQRVFKANCAKQNHIIMSTAGPNGKASWSAFSDAKAWLYNTDLFPSMVNWLEGTKMTRFYRDLVRTVRIPSADVPEATQLFLGRLHSFEEWGGKTRHVAIMDYWTQLAFTPLHDTLFHFLRAMIGDATYNPEAACEVINRWTMEEESQLYSFDLTAATDRLPIELQALVLSVLIGSESLAANWKDILVLRDFSTTDKQFIRYNCGAGMGAKSNWAMLALVHHLIVAKAAKTAGVKHFTSYRICGDDSVINSTLVANAYRGIVNSIGLKINETKSILHGAGLAPAAEFCKRVFISGSEITALNPKLIVKTVMNGRITPQLQNDLSMRGFVLPEGKLLNWFAGLTDRESVSAIALLNAIPSQLSGLRQPVPVPTEVGLIANWYKPKWALTANDIIQAYTYTAIVEQLQRLDALLRQTAVVADAIRNVSAGYSTIDLTNLGWSKEFMASRAGQAILNLQGELDIFHPIVLASKIEADRVAHLLARLAHGDASLESTARAHLLDEFRNTLVSVWDSESDARGQADRSLLNRSLDTLDRVINSKDSSRSVSFTIQLSYLQRVWAVNWTLGSQVTVNSTKSRVAISTSMANSRLDEALSAIIINGRFASHRSMKPLAKKDS